MNYQSHRQINESDLEKDLLMSTLNDQSMLNDFLIERDSFNDYN
jgi:hypothetical protein